MRILITGGNGMLGRDLQQELAVFHELFPLDHATCDITDETSLAKIFADIKPQLVINCAAYTDVDGCERSPGQAMAVNARGAGNVARAAERVGARVFHISTDYVFDGSDRCAEVAPPSAPSLAEPPEYVEQDATHPLSCYGQSKLEGERRVLASPVAPSTHLVIRTSWLYGLHRVNFVDRVVEQAQRGGPVKAVADQISCLTWTRELARGIGQLIARRDKTPAAGILHLAGSGPCTRLKNAAHIIGWLASQTNGSSATIELIPTTWAALNLPAQRPVYSAMTSSRFAELGIAPLPDWKTSLDEYFELRSKSATTTN
ncbi:MAG: dTDP-4-dehydrorhamnose reductase [Acidobacteria bacterium]|nr:dTDP-4-dehydrorhamnose reductase [Acidobacteriota bacterium]